MTESDRKSSFHTSDVTLKSFSDWLVGGIMVPSTVLEKTHEEERKKKTKGSHPSSFFFLNEL